MSAVNMECIFRSHTRQHNALTVVLLCMWCLNHYHCNNWLNVIN